MNCRINMLVLWSVQSDRAETYVSSLAGESNVDALARSCQNPVVSTSPASESAHTSVSVSHASHTEVTLLTHRFVVVCVEAVVVTRPHRPKRVGDGTAHSVAHRWPAHPEARPHVLLGHTAAACLGERVEARRGVARRATRHCRRSMLCAASNGTGGATFRAQRVDRTRPTRTKAPLGCLVVLDELAQTPTRCRWREALLCRRCKRSRVARTSLVLGAAHLADS